MVVAKSRPVDPVKAMLERAGVTFEQVRATRLQTVERMHRAGVQFVAGRDSGIQPWLTHGTIWVAADFYVEAGASTAEAAAAATSRAADACGIGDHSGGCAPDTTPTSSSWAATCRQTSRDWPMSRQLYSGASE
jgi:imidazolonepropionase-like amidohydrolase